MICVCTVEAWSRDLWKDELCIRGICCTGFRKGRSMRLSVNSHRCELQGVSCVAMLAESHISIHTWPEKGMAVCDIFTCGEHTKPKKGMEYMKMMFNAKDITSKSFIRPLE